MAEHTPGPWHQYGDCVFSSGENGGNICVVSAVRASALVEYTKLSLSSTDREEAYANARLIAAAPDLYEAVKGFLEWAENGGPLFPREQMERALAKAEGREDHHA